MNDQETAILEKLKAGDFDGFCPPARSYGSVNRGGAVDTGYIFKDGKIIEYRDVTRKFFDGKENERTTETTTRVVESDWERLDILAKLGYRMDDPDVNEYSQAYYDERRRQRAEERAAMKATAARLEEEKRAEKAMAHVENHQPQNGLTCCEKIVAESYDDSNTDNTDIGRTVLVLAAIAGAVYGAIKLTPRVKKWWKEDASPAIKNAWLKVTHKEPLPVTFTKDENSGEKSVDDSSVDFGSDHQTAIESNDF